MSVPSKFSDGKITVPSLLYRKSLRPEDATRITCLTAYDYPTARLLDEAGIEVVLVGDSLGMVMLGHETTLPVTVEEMLHHTRAVRKGTKRALVVADMPFGSYHADIAESVRNAVRFVKEAGAEAVKVEGGERRLELIARLTESEIPVMGHVGLTPQSVNEFGGFRVQGRDAEDAEKITRQAHALEELGCFSLVLECIPAPLAARITRELTIPTIGIGAGPCTDGQVLVLQDLWGVAGGHSPRFVRRYIDGETMLTDALDRYDADVKGGQFPSAAESYS